jgi:LCP family protein required for cell wall assembly
MSEHEDVTQAHNKPRERESLRTTQAHSIPEEARHTVQASPIKEGESRPAASVVGAASRSKKKKSYLLEWTLPIGVLGLFVGVVFAAVVLGWIVSQVRAQQASATVFGDIDAPTATPNATPNPDFMATPIPSWEGSERVTVLLLGADARPGETNARPLTDSIMLLMLDPDEQVASVLSIPRDLYMEVPGYGLQRINTAYPLGGGPLAKETLSYNFGIRIDYFVLLNFESFTRFVDEIGGIEVNVPATINDTRYPASCETRSNCGYDPFYIEAGLQTLDGETALKYARTRQADNDISRAERQQLVLFAIRDKVASPTTFPTLVSRAPQLYESLSSGIVTDMTLEQMIALANSAQQVERADIRSSVIDGSYLVRYFTPEGADVLIPNRERLGDLLYDAFWQECFNGGCPHAGQ